MEATPVSSCPEKGLVPAVVGGDVSKKSKVMLAINLGFQSVLVIGLGLVFGGYRKHFKRVEDYADPI